MSDKKRDQLGMPYGTASHRLRKSILWKFVIDTGNDTCFQCGKKINSVEEFSIEHKVPWLDSENPIELFLDLDNIAFSHHNCNIGAARKTEKKPCGTLASYRRGCRCGPCKKVQAERDAGRPYSPQVRRAKYINTGH